MNGSVALPRRLWLPWLGLALFLGLLFFFLPEPTLASWSWSKLWSRILRPLGRLLGYLGLGLFLGQLIECLGWTARLGALTRPIVGWGRLGADSAAAFSASFLSAVVANTMLMGGYQEGRLTKKELTLSYLANNGLPTFFLHLPTTFFILAPLVGSAGVIYLGLNFLAALWRTGIVLLWGRLSLPVQPAAALIAATSAPKSWPQVLAAVWRKFQGRFLRLVSYTLPIYLLVYELSEAGFFQWLRQGTASLVKVTFLPVEAASVVIFALATEFSAGAAAAGALLASGSLTVPQTVAALILGAVVATPVRALRHQLPTHMGIFSPKLGGQLLLASQIMRVASLILVVSLYLWWA